MKSNTSWKLRLNSAAKEPLYQQLVDQLVALMRSGEIKVGSHLPTTRALATELQLNRNTVVKVYDHLKQLGYLRSQVGHGTVVVEPSLSDKRPAAPGISWGALMTPAVERLPLRQTLPQHSDDYRLSRMQASDDLLPLKEFQECLTAALTPGRDSSLVYAPSSGILRLREHIRQELLNMGVTVSTDEIIVTNGSSQALDLVLRSLVSEGDKILLEDPTYHGGILLLKLAGAQLVAVPSDAQGPDVHRLPPHMLKDVKAIYLIPNYRNPTATSISEKRRQEIALWAVRHGILIIEDDFAFELGFAGPTPKPLKHWAPDHVIYVNSFSKRLFPALRLGYLVVPKGLLADKLHNLKWVADLGSSALLQAALAEFIERGHYKSYLERAMSAFRERRQVMHQVLQQQMPREIRWQLPEGGLFFWLQTPKELNVETLMLKCAERHLQISGGHAWSASGSPLGGIRITFCSETPERITQGVAILGEVIKEMLSQPTSQNQSHNQAFA